MSENRHIRKQRRAHKLIVREGQPAILRDESGDQGCFVLEEFYQQSSIDGRLLEAGERRFLMSALMSGDSDSLLESAPPTSNHRLVLEDPMNESGETELIMAQRPGRLCPATIVIYYELTCRAP